MQAMAKWAARFNLGRSTSVPGLILETSNILYEEDIGAFRFQVSFVARSQVYAESQQDSDMTDGCGFINLAGLKFLHKNLHLGDFPAAVQCRVAGAKVQGFPRSSMYYRQLILPSSQIGPPHSPSH